MPNDAQMIKGCLSNAGLWLLSDPSRFTWFIALLCSVWSFLHCSVSRISYRFMACFLFWRGLMPDFIFLGYSRFLWIIFCDFIVHIFYDSFNLFCEWRLFYDAFCFCMVIARSQKSRFLFHAFSFLCDHNSVQQIASVCCFFDQLQSCQMY